MAESKANCHVMTLFMATTSLLAYASPPRQIHPFRKISLQILMVFLMESF